MSLAQSRCSKRYKDQHRTEHLALCRRNYWKNKKRQNKATNRRGKEITAGAKRWRKTVGPAYWTQKYGGFG